MASEPITKHQAFKRILKACGFEFLKVSKSQRKSVGWQAKRYEGLYLIKVVSAQELVNFDLVKERVLANKLNCGADFAMVLTDQILSTEMLTKLREERELIVYDRHVLGATLSLLLEFGGSSELLDHTSLIRDGHFGLEGSDHRFGSIMVMTDMEGTHRVRGFAAYGTRRFYGPNMGSFEVSATNLNGPMTLMDGMSTDITIFSAAAMGNTILLEYASEFSDEYYQARLQFTEHGLEIEEKNTHAAPYGHNVSFSGYYEEAIFPSSEASRPHVSDAEIDRLACDFRGTYRSFQIGTAEIRNWLNQFAPYERRPMFYLLSRVRFYSALVVREAARHLHTTFLSHFALHQSDYQSKILLVAYGTPAKSGSSLTRIYRQENSLTESYAVSISNLREAFDGASNIDYLIIVEDIIGTGQDVLKLLEMINDFIGAQLVATGITVVIQAICVLEDGSKAVAEFIRTLPFKTILFAFESHEKCFATPPDPYYVDEDWNEIQMIAAKYGKKLYPSGPLGYCDSQMLVVFHDNCPNNTLPIFWETSMTTDFYWQALFPRI